MQYRLIWFREHLYKEPISLENVLGSWSSVEGFALATRRTPSYLNLLTLFVNYTEIRCYRYYSIYITTIYSMSDSRITHLVQFVYIFWRVVWSYI